jgi:RES domain-containing protein
VQVFRIAKTRNIKDLTGIGARIYGGRWNHKGISLIYTSENRSLATVEYLVHVPLSMMPVNLSVACIEIPNRIIPQQFLIPELPRNWRAFPAPPELADLGTHQVLANESLLLRVPSSVVENEFNVLINPTHPDIRHVTISYVEGYAFDKRLLR